MAKNSFTNENNVNTNKPVFQNNELIYYRAHPYPLCMYSISPCTHFDSKVIKNYFNYYKLFIQSRFIKIFIRYSIVGATVLRFYPNLI